MTTSLNQAKAEFEAGFVPRLHKNTLAFAPALLKSSLFSARTGARTMFMTETQLPGHSGAHVFYQGEELRQDDLRVLLGLVKLREGSLITRTLKIAPREFATFIGRADSSTSVAVIKASLIRLQQARVRIKTPRGEGYYSLVASVEFERGEWRVELSERVAELLGSSTLTCLDKDARFGARDGLQSWLYGAVKADACFAPFSLDALQEWTGLTGYAQKEFARVLRKELNALQEAGDIDSYAITGGKTLKIKKAGKAEEQLH